MKKLTLRRETLYTLDSASAGKVAGGLTEGCITGNSDATCGCNTLNAYTCQNENTCGGNSCWTCGSVYCPETYSCLDCGSVGQCSTYNGCVTMGAYCTNDTNGCI